VPDNCDICGSKIDPALIDSHREACRANYRRRVRTAQEESAATAEAMRQPQPPLPNKAAEPDEPTEDLSPEEACVVCIERQKVYAFVPCGHLAVCKLCAPQLDLCPICRGVRQGLLFVEPTSKLCVCKHCKHVIGPTFFDAHREVCALRMRQEQSAREAAAAAAQCSGGASPTATSEYSAADVPLVPPTTDETRLCVECRRAPRDHALLPCGHYLFCGACARNTPVCPQCCVAVSGAMPMYHA
jgi:hypothetical protein